ncbi:MAG: DUF167 domain-containing protein [Candidatus Andeanibacterium colombiense]|uniref:DUF167 domain-containing protein n=1 Tax=Candidatus Andeanibacterium colombiense TaxID=3121345 RepID=A0AAJ5X6M6_9SPHN|nr:MAG: DUF167 domain-containing protein [Sphingomonadaceae bacterium]
MAKPKADFPPAEAIRALLDGEGRLAVKVTPGARIEALEIAGGKLLAKVRAKPKDGEANDAVQALLAEGLEVARSRLTLLRGATAREKLFRLDQS